MSKLALGTDRDELPRSSHARCRRRPTRDLRGDRARSGRPGPSRQAGSRSACQGRFLVASRDLLDPNFTRTVVLLVDYNSQGALGVIVNRPTEIRVRRFSSRDHRAAERNDTVWLADRWPSGGRCFWPVPRKKLEDTQSVLDEVVFTASREVPESLIAGGGEFRLYGGYAAWGPGQLDREIERGGWRIFPASADMVFDTSRSSFGPP